MQSLKVCKALAQPFIENSSFLQQIRTTYVVKRRFPAPLMKPGRKPEAYIRKEHHVYETIQSNHPRTPQPLKILLTKYVEDVGRPGEVVTVKDSIARFLILTKKAEYPSEDNLLKAGATANVPAEDDFSSRYVGFTVRELSSFILNISLSKENPWTLEPWHIRSAFRKAHVHVPEDCFTMPEDPIKGPDMNLEGKEFVIVVTINNKETVPVRCRIHHWATNEKDRVPIVRDHWKFPVEPVKPIPEELASKLPPIIPPELKPDDGTKHIRKRRLQL